ncbi:hypothetical protein D3C80_393550 [compost metagenome]
MHRKLDGDATRFTNAFAQTVSEFKMVAVAGRKVRTGLRNADDRAVRLKFSLAQAEIHVTLEIKRRHIRIGGVVEPRARTKLALGCGQIVGFGHDAVSSRKWPTVKYYEMRQAYVVRKENGISFRRSRITDSESPDE